jgi:hypothetical protein
MGKEKQVIMTYQEHMQWIQDREGHKKELNRMGDLLAEQEGIMEKLIKERDDIVVIRQGQMVVQKNWRIRPGNSLGYHSYEDRYVNFPRFVSGDELAKELDQGFVEMHGEIRDLENRLNDEKAGRKRDKMEFFDMNKCIPINVWNNLSKRSQRKIRWALALAEERLKRRIKK